MRDRNETSMLSRVGDSLYWMSRYLERAVHTARLIDVDFQLRLDQSPEAPGLLAASLGLSRMYDDDLEQLEAGMLLYDAFYRWCRDASGETHNWPTNKAKP